MADAITVATATKNDLIISMVQKELAFKAKLLPFVSDFSAFAAKGMKTIQVPRLSSFTASNRAFGVAGDATALSDSIDEIALDQNAYVAYVIDESDVIQSSIDWRIASAERAAASHARKIDLLVLSTLNTVASLNINAGVPADITVDDILAMREHIQSNEGELENTVLVIGPLQEKAMLLLPEFSRQDYYGNSNIPTGMIGRVYGVPVCVHTGVAGKQCYMFEKSGLGFAFQKGIEMSEQPANEFGANSVRTAIDALYGIGGLQLGEKAVLATESPLVAKLEN